MKTKDYDKKRKELKDLKRENKETHFEDTKHRKAFIDDIKRSFRSVKRSEKQVIKKEMIDNAYCCGDAWLDDPYGE